MIGWRKFNIEELPHMLEKIGSRNNIESNTIIVMVKFDADWDELRPRFANITSFKGLPLSINVSGMTGKIVISHWSEINKPKKEVKMD